MLILYDYENALMDVALCFNSVYRKYCHPETREQCTIVMNKLEAFKCKFHDLYVQAVNNGNSEDLISIYKTCVDEFNDFKTQYGV